MSGLKCINAANSAFKSRLKNSVRQVWTPQRTRFHVTLSTRPCMFQTCSSYLNVFHPFASLCENRLCISCQSQELHRVDSPWNGSEQSLIALAATVSLLALSIIISNLPHQIAAVCHVDITTSLIAILKPSFHFPSPHRHLRSPTSLVSHGVRP